MTKERFKQLVKRWHPDNNNGSNRFTPFLRNILEVRSRFTDGLNKCADCSDYICKKSIRCRICSRRLRRSASVLLSESVMVLFVLMCSISYAPPSPQTESINLGWDITEPSATSIKIYWGQGPTNISGWNGTNIAYRVYTGSSLIGLVSSNTITGLYRNTRYYFAVTSYFSNEFGVFESDYSNEVYKDVPKKPNSPSNLREQ